MQGDDTGPLPAGLPNAADAALWRRSRMTDAVEDAAERALDLAGFADERLDPDDRERVAEWLGGDPLAAGDVAAARLLATRAEPLAAAPEPVIARACALVAGGLANGGLADGGWGDGGERRRGAVVPFSRGHRALPTLHSMAGWGSLAAAMAVASWLGFALGMDTSLSLGQAGARFSVQGGQSGEEGFLGEMLDPGAGFMRDLTEGAQT